MKRFSSICCLLLAIFTSSLSLVANAQQTLGSINGTVLDPSGAAVPASKVTITDTEIGVTRTVVAQANGYFQVFNLPVGTYKVQATHDGFETTDVAGVQVQEAHATTLSISLKVGQASQSVDVVSNPLLNSTDTTNGYTLDASEIALTPLATGSFTQLAVLSPGVSAELLSGVDTNAGLGNQPIWANGQRDTSNTFQVNGVDVTNSFNGKSSSSSNSQRYNFNIGAGGSSTSAAGAGTIGGANQTGGSVYGSNGNSLPSPPPEFLQELRVNASMYDAQQGATSGAQVDANTISGGNRIHGQVYGSFADNQINADPFFFKQQYLLGLQGIGAFPRQLANPQLHRWTGGAAIQAPLINNKLFYALGYQHLYASDESTGLSQFTVPYGLTNDRSTAGLDAAATQWANGTPFTSTISPIASALLNATLPNGQYLIPSNQTPGQTIYQYGVPNVTLVGVSVLASDQATGSLDYAVTNTDRLSFKYYYQNDPLTKPYGYSNVGGFPTTTFNTAQVGALDNTISFGARINWELRLGYARTGTYSSYNQKLAPSSTLGYNYGIGSGETPASLGLTGLLPGLLLSEFAVKSSVSPALKVGPFSSFADMGYHQNRLNPSTNVIYSLGKHTLIAGGGFSYSQLNVDNNRTGIAQITAQTFETFLTGGAYKSNVLETLCGPPQCAKLRNLADRYYRFNEGTGYVQDKWQMLSNLSITAGVRYDYHGGFKEKYGNFFNFNPSLYNVSGTDTTGFTVTNAGLVIAPNNPNLSGVPSTNIAGSDSTLTGRQWGISPRLGFAFAPKRNGGKVVFSGGAGIYYDRGELFSYLSQPAGSGTGGPFGVTESAPLASYVSSSKTTLANPLGAALTSASYVPPSVNPSIINTALQSQLNAMTATSSLGGYVYGNCTGVGDEEDATCPAPLNFGSYAANNVLPYTINFTLSMQWQPRDDMSIKIGYTGNRGRHSVIPVPINEAQIATPGSPAMIGGANPHSSGETASYGFEVLNQNTCVDKYCDYAPIGSEPWQTYDGGNVDFRVPYVGFNPNAVLFKTVGVSSYDALETHIEKRMSHHFLAAGSYTWSHALDEQSDIGIFFTGDNPNHLRDSWASADFDRTNIFSGIFQAEVPNTAKPYSLLSYFTNGWSVTGIGIAQSGEPYSLYEYYGAVGSAYVGNYPSLENPALGIVNPSNPKSALTGNKGSFRGAGGSYIPAINPAAIAINYLQPGQKGVPTAAQGNPGDPLDTYETDFAPGDQRNIFRQAFQKRLDISIRKTFGITDRVKMLLALNIFNVTNTTSLDVPQNQTQIRQTGYACSNSALAVSGSDCAEGYTYGQVATSLADQASANNGRGTAGANLDKLPVTNSVGSNVTLPLTLAVGQGTCSASTISSGGCPNNGANFGSVTGTIGGNRAATLQLHVLF